METTEARVKWMNSHSVKEKQRAIVTFLKIAMACQEGPTYLTFQLPVIQPRYIVIMTSAYYKQAPYSSQQSID